jgi:hypothetical protein
VVVHTACWEIGFAVSKEGKVNTITKRAVLWRRQLERDLVSSKKLAFLFMVKNFQGGIFRGLDSVGFVRKVYYRKRQGRVVHLLSVWTVIGQVNRN